jgi:hypothetical protein
MTPAQGSVAKPTPQLVADWRATDYRQHTGLLFAPRPRNDHTVAVELNAFAADVYKHAKTKPYYMSKGVYSIYAFPVKYEHKECLSCHSGTKLRDTAAVVAFAFKKAND